MLRLWNTVAAPGRDAPEAPADQAAFHRACAVADGPRRYLNHLHALVTGSGTRDAVSRLGPAAHALIKALTLAAAGLHIRERQHPGAHPTADGNSLVVASRDAFTADMVASVRHDTGAIVRVVPGDPGLRLDNVRRDTPARTYGEGDLAFDAWAAELLAWADQVWSGEDLLEQTLNPTRLRPGEVPDLDDVRDRLADVEAQHGAKPLVSIPYGGDSALARDASLVQRLQQDLGVASYLLKADGLTESDREVGQITSTLRNRVAQIFQQLLPKASTGRALPQGRTQVFISYAHKDDPQWRNQLLAHLKGLPESGGVKAWADTELTVGDDWFARIDAALKQSACAVLMLSVHFLASDFIQTKELPDLLERHQREGLLLLPIVVGTCNWDLHPELARIQALCAKTPLAAMTQPDQPDQALAALARHIHDHFNPQGRA